MCCIISANRRIPCSVLFRVMSGNNLQVLHSNCFGGLGKLSYL